MQHLLLLLLLAAPLAKAAEVVQPLKDFEKNPLAVQVTELDELRRFFKLTQYGKLNYSRLKVAVLDKGFAGVYPARDDGRRWLPASTEVVESFPDAETVSPLDPQDFHGTHMAHLVWAMTGYAASGPQFRLYNASSPENFIKATQDLIRWGADVVLFSQNWPGFGNFDGSGFINEALREVTDHQILWFNAAGNYGGKVYNGPVKLQQAGENWWVKFKSKSMGDDSYFLKFVNNVDENRVTISLAWNSVFPGWVKKGTDKDLKLTLYASDKDGKLINEPLKSTQLVQTKTVNDPAKETLFPLEELKVVLPRGTYYLAVEAVSNAAEFSEKQDRVRITVMGSKQPFWDSEAGKLKSSVTFTDATKDGEIMTPADGPGLTVGDMTIDSAKGPTVDGRGKPEIVLEKNNVTFSDKNGFYGTSYAAAYMAGIAVVLKATAPGLRQTDLLKFRKFYPTGEWEEAGWEAWTSSSTWWVDREVKSWVEDRFGAPHAFVKRSDQGPSLIGLVGDIPAKFTSMDRTVAANKEDYQFFMRVQRTPTTKTVKDPDRTEWKWVTLREGYYKTEWKTERKSRKVMVRQGQYYWDYETNSQRVDLNLVDIYGRNLGSVNLGTLYTQTPKMKYKEPEYDYQYYNVRVPHKVWVPAEKDYRKVTIPGQYRQVPGKPIVKKFLTWVKKGSTQPVWERYNGKPEEFTALVELEAPSHLGDGLVVDGSKKEPRIWETPSPAELRNEVQ